MVVYLEEEAVVGYTGFLAQVDAGAIENVPAPRIAIDYWKPHKHEQLREVIIAVRADEAKHRDVTAHSPIRRRVLARRMARGIRMLHSSRPLLSAADSWP